MTPFFNGQNPLDAFTASLLLASLYQTNLEGMQTVFGTIEPCEVTYFPGDLVTPPCAVIVSQNYVAVVCLGSVTWGQWILNFLGSAQVTLPPIPGQVSAYFGGAGLAITANISSLVTSAAPGRRVVFIGHSLGGAAVQISASVLPVPGSLGTAVWTFGAPRVGNGAFAASINSITQRWENTNDPIPAVPPQLWAGPGSVFPVPGPPPFALYVHAGVASTINADGSITPGSNPPSLSNVALQFASGDLPTHYPSAYAQRLLAGLPASAFTNPDNGYQNAPLLVAFYNDFYGASFLIPTGGTQVAAKNRVTLFYSYAGYGMTESWYTNLSGFNLTQQISSYLLARMGLSVFAFEFVYARVTFANSNRLVSFYAPSTPGFTVHGSFGTAGVAPTTALLYRYECTDTSGGRIFIHGAPASEFQNQQYVPTAPYAAAVLNFTSQLQSGGFPIFFQNIQPNLISDRLKITSLAPLSPRGYTITPAVATAVTPGDVITVGGLGASISGAAGRKVVTVVPTGGATFNVGGATPNGTYTGGNGYYQVAIFLYQQILSAYVLRATEHRVGRVFGQSRGRRANLIPLRR